jgi:L-lactate dehydrogenase complex protein LldG
VEAKLFLDRVAARLGRAGRRSTPPVLAAPLPESYAASPLGVASVDRAERFKQELELVGCKVTFAASLADVHAALRAELAAWNARRLVSWALAELEGWKVDELLAEAGCAAYAGPTGDRSGTFAELCQQADLGITTVDFAIVGTGTLALAAGPGRPRAVSLVPTVHLALVRETQLVDRLGQAFDGFRDSGRIVSSNVTFITGPSRTSDIENDLSIGVHGPAAVSVILWRDRATSARSG